MKGLNTTTKSLITMDFRLDLAGARYKDMCGAWGRGGRYGTRFHFLPAWRSYTRSVYIPSFPFVSLTFSDQVCDFQVSTLSSHSLHSHSLTPRSLPPFGIAILFKQLLRNQHSLVEPDQSITT
jgi:hypothetical protein